MGGRSRACAWPPTRRLHRSPTVLTRRARRARRTRSRSILSGHRALACSAFFAPSAFQEWTGLGAGERRADNPLGSRRVLLVGWSAVRVRPVEVANKRNRLARVGSPRSPAMGPCETSAFARHSPFSPFAPYGANPSAACEMQVLTTNDFCSRGDFGDPQVQRSGARGLKLSPKVVWAKADQRAAAAGSGGMPSAFAVWSCVRYSQALKLPRSAA